LKASNIKLPNPLPPLECDWLVGRLRAQPGIAAAVCAGGSRELTVEYDGDRLVSGDLVDFLSVCGVRVAAVRAVHA